MPNLKTFYYNFACTDDDLNWFDDEVFDYFTRLQSLKNFTCHTNQCEIQRSKIPDGYDINKNSVEVFKLLSSIQ